MTPKVLNELYDLSRQAVRTWMHAVAEAIKESGKELPLNYNDEEERGLEVSWTEDNYVHKCYATKVRYCASKWIESANYEIFIVSDDDGREINEWQPVHYFSIDEIDYIFSEINWEK